MNTLNEEREIVRQRIEIETLQEEKAKLENLIKEMKAYNRLSLQNRKEINNKIIDLENRVRKTENRINELIDRETKEKSLLDKMRDLFRIDG